MKETMYLNLRQGVKSPPNLIPVNEFDPDKLVKNPNKDYYVGLYKYTEKHKQILEQTGTLAGVQDNFTNRLYFDFDSLENLEQARQDAITTAQRLVDKGIPDDAIECYFTGYKGFSVEVNVNDNLSPKQFKAAVFNLASDLETFDRTINDPQRIVRISNTKHQKSGLFKIPLSPEELCDLSIDEIKDKAKVRRVIDFTPKVVDVPKELLELPVEPTYEKIAQELTFDLNTIDLKHRPKGFDEARWLLANGFFRHGDRHYAILCLAATCKNLHYTESQTRGMLEAAANDQADRTGEDPIDLERIDKAIEDVYSPTWKGGMFTTRDPNNWLAQYARKMGLKNTEETEDIPRTLQAIAPSFIKHVMEIEKNTIKTGIPSLDRAIPITVGSNVGVVAAAGAGKTALAMLILKNNSKNDIVTVFASLDMHRVRLFEKVAYNVTGLSRDDLYAQIRAGKYQEIIDKIQAEYGNVWFYDKSAATVADITQYVKDVEAHTGQKVKLVMIDYFERVNCDVADDTAASKKIANQIQDMIVDLDVAVITLCQPNKMSLGAGPDTEITSYTSIKGSSFLYQSFRGIIGLSRPFYTPKTKDWDKYTIINLLKNDLGELDRLEFGWVGKTGTIYELEDCERQELHELMKMKNKSGNENEGWD
jgi:hypothetical protein